MPLPVCQGSKVRIYEKSSENNNNTEKMGLIQLGLHPCKKAFLWNRAGAVLDHFTDEKAQLKSFFFFFNARQQCGQLHCRSAVTLLHLIPHYMVSLVLLCTISEKLFPIRRDFPVSQRLHAVVLGTYCHHL